MVKIAYMDRVLELGIPERNLLFDIGPSEIRAVPDLAEEIRRALNPKRGTRIAEKIGLDFIVNTVLDRQGKAVRIVAGHFGDAHREGVEKAPNLCLKLGLRHVFPAQLDGYVRRRLAMNPNPKIGVMRHSAEILPLLNQPEDHEERVS